MQFAKTLVAVLGLSFYPRGERGGCVEKGHQGGEIDEDNKNNVRPPLPLRRIKKKRHTRTHARTHARTHTHARTYAHISWQGKDAVFGKQV